MNKVVFIVFQIVRYTHILARCANNYYYFYRSQTYYNYSSYNLVLMKLSISITVTFFVSTIYCLIKKHALTIILLRTHEYYLIV